MHRSIRYDTIKCDTQQTPQISLDSLIGSTLTLDLPKDWHFNEYIFQPVACKWRESESPVGGQELVFFHSAHEWGWHKYCLQVWAYSFCGLWHAIFAQAWSWQYNWVLSLDRQTAEPPKHLHSELLQSNWLVSLISETTQTSASTFSLICSVVLSLYTVCKNHRPLSIDASRYRSSRIFLASAVSTAELAHGPWN